MTEAAHARVAPTAEPTRSSSCELESSGILLYYKYVSLDGSQAEGVARWYEVVCKGLGLTGRIRVARDGVNVTVGGSLEALREHAAAVSAHPVLCGADIDFKLAPSRGSRNDVIRRETGMDTLVVRLCEELVTLGPLARHRADPRVSTAPHLTPDQFHEMIAAAAAATPAPHPAAAAGCATGGGAARGGPAAAPGDSTDGAGGPSPPPGPVVLLDARNIYETRIGHFDGGPSLPTLDPRTRCFSDLPAWLDQHEEALRNRTVLMYCTGGVRCERASAYLREKGPEFSRVFQLSGGIQRYLERFTDGGFFRGKNFLYDDRIAVGPEASGAPGGVGRCQQCDRPWDDYGARVRCSRCRLLLLVCDPCLAALGAPGTTTAGCEGGGESPSPPPQPPQRPRQFQLLCELCSEGGTGASSAAGTGPVLAGAHQRGPEAGIPPPSAPAGSRAPPPLEPPAPPEEGRMRDAAGPAAAAGATASAAPASPGPPARRLRILCLHGFRQTGKQFMGRTCALRKKLRDLADFEFIDAPHTLPYFAKKEPHPDGATTTSGDRGDGMRGGGGGDEAGEGDVRGGIPGKGECEGGEGLSDVSPTWAAEREEGRDAAEQGRQGRRETRDEPAAAAATVAAPAEAAAAAAGAKRAWLLPPELYGRPEAGGLLEGATATGGTAAWQVAPSYVDELQYTRQTAGWSESLAVLRRAVRERGPYDGVLGFSQGAAVAAVLCALQQRHRQRQRQPGAASASPLPASPTADNQNRNDSNNDNPEDPDRDDDDNDFGFRFAILASGFSSLVPEHQALLAATAPLELPSLHIYDSTAPSASAPPSGHATPTTPGSVGGGGGGDRQIPPEDSERLAGHFGGGGCGGGVGQRRVLRHQCGHLIPATRTHAATVRAFLEAQRAAGGPGES